jgi:hypothetical protein
VEGFASTGSAPWIDPTSAAEGMPGMQDTAEGRADGRMLRQTLEFPGWRPVCAFPSGGFPRSRPPPSRPPSRARRCRVRAGSVEAARPPPRTCGRLHGCAAVATSLARDECNCAVGLHPRRRQAHREVYVAPTAAGSGRHCGRRVVPLAGGWCVRRRRYDTARNVRSAQRRSDHRAAPT